MASSFRLFRNFLRSTARTTRARKAPVRNYVTVVARAARKTTAKNNYWGYLFGGATVGVVALIASTGAEEPKKAAAINYDAVRKDIEGLLEEHGYDDGSYAPLFIRLAWHAAGTYDHKTGTGGAGGATMRFEPESAHGANKGLKIARERLEKVKVKYPDISYADLWTLAGVVAVEAMGGPKIKWRPGRDDHTDGKKAAPDGRLPDANQGSNHVRDIFYRMGFNDQEIVALIGAHAVGRCHTDRSGYEGPWTQSPTVFSNDFYVQLVERKWTERKWNGPKQFQDESGQLMMTPADMSMISDPEFAKWVHVYAKDEDKFKEDFAKAFGKLLELGTKFPEGK